MGENAGFCRANNAGIEASDSEYVLLINTDARLTDGCLDGMLSYFERVSTVRDRRTSAHVW